MMLYPARFEPSNEGGFVVTFRDIPEAITQGDSEEEAIKMAEDALVSAMSFYFEDRRTVPMPSPVEPGERLLSIPASVCLKVLLLNELVDSGISNAELARRMGTRPQEVQRIVDLGHATKIDTIERAFEALGKQLEIIRGIKIIDLIPDDQVDARRKVQEILDGLAAIYNIQIDFLRKNSADQQNDYFNKLCKLYEEQEKRYKNLEREYYKKFESDIDPFLISKSLLR